LPPVCRIYVMGRGYPPRTRRPEGTRGGPTAGEPEPGLLSAVLTRRRRSRQCGQEGPRFPLADLPRNRSAARARKRGKTADTRFACLKIDRAPSIIRDRSCPHETRKHPYLKTRLSSEVI